MKRSIPVACRSGAIVFALCATPIQAEQTGSSSGLAGIDYSFSGSMRIDNAFSTSSSENPLNQRGNLFNGVPVQRNSVIGVQDTATRTGMPADNDFNLEVVRAELNAKIKLTPQLDLVAKLRALWDPGVYQEFDPGDVGSQAVGKLYGRPNYFEYDTEGLSHPNPLEWAGKNGMVDLPALFFEYNRGPLNLRAGNQQIAWGQAIFFRVLDVANGLDLRRHSALDLASEEFSDKRVPALGLRGSYQINDRWLLDSFVQKFQPTIQGNPNTQYNAIASQFTIHDRYADFDDKFNYGLRLKGDFGAVGLQAIAVRRYNPDGVYRWTESGVNRDLPSAPGSGAVLEHTPFEVDPSGVWSADEWFTYAAMSRLDGTEGLNSAVNEFAASGLLGAYPVATRDQAAQELDLFFQLSGSGLRGHLGREYRQETDLGAGASYVISAAPGSLLDQLIINVETLYTPNRSFTNPSLSRDYLEQDEWTTALVMEKYQRFAESLPATYMVAQWLHKTRSDLFGRSLEGMGGDVDHTPSGYSGGFDAVVLALQRKRAATTP
ncbi:MAG: hypothetical protein JWQ90_1043 [Hydrocarboniphaga sp.]|uniref:DUF1302 family protein n=1 Tax=Hydrocarboniphaga sp. TaxID=2033016 RepID=UPI0026059B34|nr:DUF1302 family protein [Hydrocarboniphaga sp.]MDB5968593.1 hypothetical protein [Hydrocarboniphaga sp.]